METACRVAAHIPTFYQQDRPAPAPAGPADDGPDPLLVLSSDATGVNMIPADLCEAVRAQRSSGGPQPPSAQLFSREHTGRRRMATVYDSTPVVRTGADVLPRTTVERAARTAGPRTRGRHLAGSLEHSTAAMVAAMFDHAEQRDPGQRRRWVVLVDGANHQLECIGREAAARGVHVDTIVDIVHVIARVRTVESGPVPEHGDPVLLVPRHVDPTIARFDRVYLIGDGPVRATTTVRRPF
jgi:hypothetical protein